MQTTFFMRRGRTISFLGITDEQLAAAPTQMRGVLEAMRDGPQTREFPSINAAKKESRLLQQILHKTLGLGGVRRVRRSIKQRRASFTSLTPMKRGCHGRLY